MSSGDDTAVQEGGGGIQQHPELRDPMTNVYSFLVNPSHLHRTCWFFVECYEHCQYLETEHTTPYLIRLKDRRKKGSRLHGKPIPIPCQYLKKVKQNLNRSLNFKLCFDNVVGMNFLNSLAAVGCLNDSIKSVLVSRCPAIVDLYLEALPALDELYVRDLPNLESISGAWVIPPTVAIFERLPSLELVGDGWLAHPPSWEERKPGLGPATERAEFRDLPSLTAVGDRWLENATKLEELQLYHLPSLQSIGSHWLARTKCLAELELTDLPQLTSIGSWWLEESGVEKVTLVGLLSLESIGRGALSNCRHLEEIAFSNLPKLKTTDGLGDCCPLKTASFTDLPELVKIGDWFEDSLLRGLETLHFANIPKLKKKNATIGRCSEPEYINVAQFHRALDVGGGISKDLEYLLAEITQQHTDRMEELREEEEGDSQSQEEMTKARASTKRRKRNR